MDDRSLSLLAAVLAQAPFGFAVVDRDLRYLHINEMLAALNGLPPEAHRGLRPADISAEMDALVTPVLTSILASGQAVTGLEYGVRSPATGQLHHFLFSAYPVSGPDGTPMAVAASVADITERRRTQDRLEAQARQQAAVVELGLAALRGDTVKDLLRQALRALREVLAMEQAAVVRAEPGTGAFALYGVDPPRADLVEGTVAPGDRTQAGQTLAAGEPIVMEDRATETRFDTCVGAVGMAAASSITALVPVADGPFGVLGVYDSAPREITDDEVRFVQAVAGVIGTAVERRRTERELEASNTRLRMAQEAGRMGVWEWDLREDRIIWSEALEHLYGLPAGGFDGTYEMFLTFVHPDDAQRTQAAVESALAAGGYETEHRIVRADTGEARWIEARGEVIRDDRGRNVRMVGINIDITERKGVEEDRAALLEAEQAARTEAEAARERLTFLAEATAAFSGSLDYEETLASVTRLAVPRMGDLCVVALMINGRLETVAVTHRDPEMEQRVRDLRATGAGAPKPGTPGAAALATGRTVVIEEVTDELLAAMAVDEKHLADLRTLQLRSAVLVPLIARGRALGLLALARSTHRPGFGSSDDAALLTEVGRRAALAIDNARLFAEVTRTGDRFRRMADTLQASLLPPSLPAVPGVNLAATYRPAAAGTTVGGDFYDVFPRADGAWGMVIGDVQGKGMEAASLTALTRHTLRTAAIRLDPAGALRILNEVLVTSEAHEGRFCTALYGELRSTADGVAVTLASGGHPPALLRRAATGRVEAVGGSGTLLGVLDDPIVSTHQVELLDSDVLVLYTDGATEAWGEDGELGEERLAQVLAETRGTTADDYVKALEDAIMAHSSGRLRDDLAIVAIRADAR